MSTNSFSKEKRLRVTLILSPENSNGVFPGTNSNTLVLEGMRVLANIQTVPGSVATHADVKIFGMKREFMNALTTIFFNVAAGHDVVFNNMILEADSGDGFAQVFSGMITEAQPEYRGAPNVYFGIQAIVGYRYQIMPVPPQSFQGSVGVADIVAGLASKMGYAFENDGVTAQLSNPYLWGTYWDQLNRVCVAAGIRYAVAGDTLAIYPMYAPRVSVPIFTLSPSSGLLGYPTLERFGIVITSLYNPGLQPGGRVRVVDSDVPNANGLWYPFLVDHQLEGNAPGGAWFTVSQCQPVAA